MQTFRKACEKDVEWRIQEIAMIRKSTMLMEASDDMRALLRRYAIPALYAVWEGFVVFALSECAKRINSKKIRVGKANSCIVRHNVFEKFNLHNLPVQPAKQERLLASIYGYFKERLVLSLDIHTNSNVEFKELCKLMSHYGVFLVDKCQYCSRLKKFLNYRNGIAHGNREFEVTKDLLKEFADLISELMELVVNELDECLSEGKYLSNPMIDALQASNQLATAIKGGEIS